MPGKETRLDVRKWAEWQPVVAGEVTDPRDINVLSSELDLPEGLRLETRPQLKTDGSSGFAVVIESTSQPIVIFELRLFFNASQIKLLKAAVHQAIERAGNTGKVQIARF